MLQHFFFCKFCNACHVVAHKASHPLFTCRLNSTFGIKGLSGRDLGKGMGIIVGY